MKKFIFTVNYDWLKFCLSSSLILSNRGCLIDLYFEKHGILTMFHKIMYQKPTRKILHHLKKIFRMIK